MLIAPLLAAPLLSVPSGISDAGITNTVISGPFLLAALLALAAGAVSFASPCVVPLVPGYLSYLAGLVGAEGAAAGTGRAGTATAVRTRIRGRAVLATLLFVLGFTVVFVAETALVLGLASTFLVNQDMVMRIGGAVTIAMGLVMAGFVPLLQREARVHARPQGRFWGAPLLGAAFGTGWLACSSPALAGVVALSAATDWGGAAWRGLFLVLIYCAGLGIPFVLLALGFGWAGTALGFLRRHARGIQLVGAAALIVIGTLMVTGVWGTIIAKLQTSVVGFGTVL